MTYTVTPTSADGCIGDDFTIIINVNGLIDDQADITHLGCFGVYDGSIEINPIGGTPLNGIDQYLFNWSGPNNFSSESQNIYNLQPGIYNLIITDQLSCEFNFEYIIDEPDPLQIQIDLEQDVLCSSGNSGEIQITAIGGIGPYIYEWTYTPIGSGNSQFYSDSEDLTDLFPGTYVLILYDSNNCGPITQIFQITEPEVMDSILDSKVDVLCFGENTGSIEITITGGNPIILDNGSSEYNYQWTGPGFTSDDEDIYDLVAGQYNLLVTDNSGCEFSASYEITQPEELSITYTTTDNSCYQSNDGSISLDIQGGVEPYDIFWSNLGNGPIQSNLSAGIYDVTVIDSHECEKIVSIEILEAPVFYIDPVFSNISCFGETDGYINLNINGGIDPIFVTWDDDPSAGEERNNLTPGTYTVLIEDSSGNNCSITESFIIIEPQELVLNAIIQNPLDCDDVNSGSIDLQIIGGTQPYEVQWSNDQTIEDLTNIAAGNYAVNVIDFEGCEAIAQYELFRPSEIQADLITSFTADCDAGIPFQTTELVISGGVPPYIINWSGGEISGDNGEIMSTSQNGFYTADIIDSLGCNGQQIVIDVNLEEIGIPGFNFDSEGLEFCDVIGIGDVVNFTNISSGDYLNIIWDFGDGTVPISGFENLTHIYNYNGTYDVTLTVEYPYGCIYTYIETIEVSNGYGLILPNTFTPNGDGINDTIRPWYKCMSSIEMSIYDLLAHCYMLNLQLMKFMDGTDI